MLIYNHKKEFIGIDKSYLDIFNLSTLLQLQTLNQDFADFFVKSPGYIHNFIHVHWIDYILCEDTGISPKVLININDINYSATIDIKILFLSDSPSEKSFYVNLLNIKCLNEELNEESSCDINNDDKVILDIEAPNIDELETKEKIIQEDDLSINTIDIKESTQNNEHYQFNPAIASSDLGLPIDLVIEFVQDFIEQANSFKEEFYTCISNFDNENIQTLSHKLRGVSANLRIHDAHDILTNINQSQDFNQIKKDIDIFYEIITKLSNTHPVDDLVLNFKEKE